MTKTIKLCIVGLFIGLIMMLISAIIEQQTEELIKGTKRPVSHTEEYTPADVYYQIGAFNRETKQFDRVKMDAFIADIEQRFGPGTIVSVDGLKFQKQPYGATIKHAAFSPFPNPPIPVYEPSKEDIRKHLKEYGEWIDNHPHFGFPPLPSM